MHRFTDNEGRTWVVNVNVDAIKRVRSLCNIDLLEAVDGKIIDKLIADPITLCDCLYVVCKPQADELKVTDEDFGRAMAGDCLEQATQALLEDLVDFFPSRRRQILKQALGKMKTVETRALDLAEARLMGPELDKEINAILERVGKSSGSLQE